MGPLAGLNDENLPDSACRAESTGDSDYRLHETRMRRRERERERQMQEADGLGHYGVTPSRFHNANPQHRRSQ